jgi:hypothetical protein
MVIGSVNIIDIGVSVNEVDSRLAHQGRMPSSYIFAFLSGVCLREYDVLRRSLFYRVIARSGADILRFFETKCGRVLSALMIHPPPSSCALWLH